jgi:hypothetical protein
MNRKVWVTVGMALATGVALAADEFVPKEVVGPEGIRGVIDFFARNLVLRLGVAATIVISVVSLLRVVATTFGAQLEGKSAFILAAAVNVLGAIGLVVADGELTGTDWSILAEALAVFVASTLGYRLTLSSVARNDGIVAAIQSLGQHKA